MVEMSLTEDEEIERLIRAEQQKFSEALRQENAFRYIMCGQLNHENFASTEALFAAGLSYVLKEKIRADQVRLDQQLVDSDGVVIKTKDFRIAVSDILQDECLTAFKLQASMRWPDVAPFGFAVKLLTLQNPDKHVRGVMVTFTSNEEIAEQCARYNIDLIDGTVLPFG